MIRRLLTKQTPPWGRLKPKLLTEFRKRSNWRSNDCWPVYSFVGKDADLDPEGCTGIREIEPCEEYLRVVYGGHKTVHDPTYESPYELSPSDETYYSEIAFEYVADCYYPGQWSGDDWLLTTGKEVMNIPWIEIDGEIDIPASVGTAITSVDNALGTFRAQMTDIHSLIEKLSRDIDQKYGGE